MSALIVSEVNVIANCPLAFAVCRELLDVGDVLYARRREAGPIQASSHRE
jgi:hypothetical protein